jgi:alpha-L-arabinofuranosidase
MGESMDKGIYKHMKEEYSNLIAWYPFDDVDDPGKDASGHGQHAKLCGDNVPYISKVCGSMGAVFQGGEGKGSSYLELPQDLLSKADDMTGLSISAWIKPSGKAAGWERVFDFGHSDKGPYLFLTRSLRGICYADSDLPADAGKQAPSGEWTHVVMSITPTQNGTASSAGPRLYVNGELAADGIISQTSSGNYKKFRSFMDMLSEGRLDHNYIGRSQFEVDPYYEGAISDLRIYNKSLSQEEVIDLLCQRLSDQKILDIAIDKFLKKPADMITDHISLQPSLMQDKVSVRWDIKPQGIIDDCGNLKSIDKPVRLDVTAVLSRGDERISRSFRSVAVPRGTAPYEFVVHTDEKVLDISRTLFGLFFEDINHSADGGIYAELVQNRSFENFAFNSYNASSTENGLSGGRTYKPLEYWFGDTDKVEVLDKGGVSSFLGYSNDNNPHYIRALEDAAIINRGYCSENHEHAMAFEDKGIYQFSIYAKSENSAAIEVVLQDDKGRDVSTAAIIDIPAGGTWDKYTRKIQISYKGIADDDFASTPHTFMGQLVLRISKGCCVDMVSLVPENVWGAAAEPDSVSAHDNFNGNPNYRLRRDIMKSLADMHPSFIRFPGGCISEGSYTWDNVYDWKDSIGDIAIRKENVNVWGYNMTMGLGYMEYFQMAEDLGAEPLPVMACGVLCQARSDYVNPAGGKLRDKYIANFTDLIDFAISTDFENNKWADIRKKMGHEQPFGLHYLGVGNENWGDEFFANFEIFYHKIKEHLDEYYPGYPMTIVSTAGAQADDDAYKIGWQFLCGRHKGVSSYMFTDGEKSFEEKIDWYKYKGDYLDTIVDEHYYRSNEYLLENVDRYNYYQRAYKLDENGHKVIDEAKSPKVFVGEYASVDKNTLKGAIAEAATMVGYERNSDVVRMASTAPLFNQISNDGTYRWTPDCIWFDKTRVYRTPTYFVQKLFMTNLGTELLKLDEKKLSGNNMSELKPHGGFCISASNGRVKFLNINVTSNIDGTVYYHKEYPEGLVLDGSTDTKYLVFTDAETGLNTEDLSDYSIDVRAVKLDDMAVIEVGCGLVAAPGDFDPTRMSLMKYCVGDAGNGTGLKVYKDGIEGYTLGDYSSSVYAGNLRACHMEIVGAGCEVVVRVNYGGDDGRTITASYEIAGSKGVGTVLGDIVYKLESYNKDIFASATKDAENIYLKLVNPADTVRDVHIAFDHGGSGKCEDGSICKYHKAQVIVLEADKGQEDVPNVNVPETILPRTYDLSINGDCLDISLKPWSLNIIRLKK